MGLRIKRFFKNDAQKSFNWRKEILYSSYFFQICCFKRRWNFKCKNWENLKKNLTYQGYYQFQISDKNLIKPKNYLIHRFEWECIKGVIPEGFVIDHIDSVRTNNKIENLQLLTLAENVRKGNSKPILSFNIVFWPFFIKGF